jgi:hypothetical protein
LGKEAGLLNQDQGGRLKRILRIGPAAQQTAAHAPDHRSMPPHQRHQGRRVLPLHEALQQLPVRLAGAALSNAA